MADPITNAQYALGLWQPAVNALANGNAQRLHVAESLRNEQFQFWKEKMLQEENQKNRELQDTLNNRTVNATLQGQRESTNRIIEEQHLAEARQLHRAVLEMYKNYSDLAEGQAEPLGNFGKKDEDAYEALSQEIGRLRAKNLIEPSVARLYEKYGAMGGDKAIDEFGKTPGDQIQGLSRAVGEMETKQLTQANSNIKAKLGLIDTDIQKAEMPTSDELAQAKNLGMSAISLDAKKFYDRQIKSGMSPETAFKQMAIQFPDQAQAYQEKVNGFVVGLRINKQQNDKTLRELYNSKSDLQNKAMLIFGKRPDLLFSTETTDALPGYTPAPDERGDAGSTGTVGINDAIRTTFGRPAGAGLYGMGVNAPGSTMPASTALQLAAQRYAVGSPQITPTIPGQLQPPPVLPQTALPRGKLSTLGLPDLVQRLAPLAQLGGPDLMRRIFGQNISGPNFSGVSVEQPSRGPLQDYLDTIYPNQLADEEKRREIEANFVNRQFLPPSLRGTQ